MHDDDLTQPSDSDMTTGAAAEGAPLVPGAVLDGRYRIVSLLGRGGMGEVYHAEDLRLGQHVALKFLPPALARDPRRLEQFHNEVRIARQISHPNVCKVYDIGDIDGRLFLSMEYIEGEDLSAALRRVGRFPEDRAIELSRQLCAGLAAVHERGVLHRDLKPANIMLNKAGRVQLMDFGLAASGAVFEIREGSPAYMAPEQLLGEEVTARSDIYALGLVMHQLFTGSRAFEASTLDDLVTQHASGAVYSPRTRVAGLDPSVDRAVAACLARDPAARPASAAAVAAMLQTVLLDTQATVRRWIQILLPMAGILLLMPGIQLTYRLTGAWRVWGVVMMLLGAALLVLVLRFPLKWDVSYKGHTIRFQNHPLWGERLYIDDVLVDRGRPGVHIRLRGTIESGDGAGERITSESRAALLSFGCRIVAESFLPGQR